ncbi:MAG: DUF4258 domain-containing protein, partial [bacterium]
MTRDDFDFTDHGADQMAANGLVVPDVIATVEHGEVIEEYPQAHPLPACLSFYTVNGRPVHVCWAKSSMSGKVIVITAYVLTKIQGSDGNRTSRHGDHGNA